MYHNRKDNFNYSVSVYTKVVLTRREQLFKITTKTQLLIFKKSVFEHVSIFF